MPGTTIASVTTLTPERPALCPPSRAARELALKRYEFDLAVELGRIRVVSDGASGGRRVARTEIARLQAQPGFPQTLRERVRVVGTKEGAALMGVSEGRFARLARLGLLVPVRFYLNRYRAVVWLYLAEELREFVANGEHADLMTGRTPETLRSQLTAGLDLRPRNWRGRHLGFLLWQADDPWARAGAIAAFLPSEEIAEIVEVPYERARLDRLRPNLPAHGAPGSPSALLGEQIMTARDADEIAWLSADLARQLEATRARWPTASPVPSRRDHAARRPRVRRVPALPVPRPSVPAAPVDIATARTCSGIPVSAPLPGSDHGPCVTRARRSRGLLTWLRRGSPRSAPAGDHPRGT
ncbi:hypothetical protein GT030_34240 [Streptomyces sp. SID1328]|uniref:DUF6397 family protein n=1 Tax=Streptomyces sp. SID1328 TaxID=2690250 RepID=UPI00136DF9EC|nr:DUF6397 family protein [Streptomyces sp. SID1328]MYV43786.1 hypothetical protein [Streptomyces sp. SID1328]